MLVILVMVSPIFWIDYYYPVTGIAIKVHLTLEKR